MDDDDAEDAEDFEEEEEGELYKTKPPTIRGDQDNDDAEDGEEFEEEGETDQAGITKNSMLGGKKGVVNDQEKTFLAMTAGDKTAKKPFIE